MFLATCCSGDRLPNSPASAWYSSSVPHAINIKISVVRRNYRSTSGGSDRKRTCRETPLDLFSAYPYRCGQLG